MSIRPHPILITALLFASPLFAVAASQSDADETEPAVIDYVKIKPSVVTNLARGGSYVRADIELMTRKPGLPETIETHLPAIRHALLMLFAEQDGSALKGASGREALRKAALKEARQAFAAQRSDAPKDAIADLFFTAFFVQ